MVSRVTVLECLEKTDDCNLALTNRRVFEWRRRRNEIFLLLDAYGSHCVIDIIKILSIYMGESGVIYSSAKPLNTVRNIVVLHLSEDIVYIFGNTFRIV